MPSERVQRQIDRFLDEAEAAMARSEWETVQDRALNALALDGGNEDAAAYLVAAGKRLADGGGTAGTLTPTLSQREREPESAASEPSPPGRGQGEGAAAARPAAPTPATNLYRTAFVGRDAELQQLGVGSTAASPWWSANRASASDMKMAPSQERALRRRAALGA